MFSRIDLLCLWQEQQKLRKDLEAMKVEMSEVKHESHKRKKMLVVQQQYMHSGTGGYRKVAVCCMPVYSVCEVSRMCDGRGVSIF